MDSTPSERPTKKHRSEHACPTTPVHRSPQFPITGPPAHQRKPTRSESTASSTSTIGYSSPGELVFYDDDCMTSACDQLGWSEASAAECAMPYNVVSTSGCIVQPPHVGSVYDPPAYHLGRCTPPPALTTFFDYDADESNHRSCRDHPPHGSSSPPPAAPRHHAPSHSSSHALTIEKRCHSFPFFGNEDEHQWQQNAAMFFKEIDARALRLAPQCHLDDEEAS